MSATWGPFDFLNCSNGKVRNENLKVRYSNHARYADFDLAAARQGILIFVQRFPAVLGRLTYSARFPNHEQVFFDIDALDGGALGPSTYQQ